ncbi:MAG: 50S ribosomal protein L1 [Verrucomicrobiota bacterium]|nr:50S ribosomal protein L1 [Verrucomicrobiota bacterium]
MANQKSKRYQQAAKLVDMKKVYRLEEAVSILKKMPATKFDQTVNLAIKLGVDPKQSDQMVRGTAALPHGSGKNVRVAVFAQGAAADAALAAGAEYVGFEDLIKKCSDGFNDFDVAISTPSAMVEVRKLGKVLGPRGLMPNPKTGTITDDTAKAVKEVKAGRVEFKIDKAGNIHVPTGKVSFDENALLDNIHAVIEAILKSRPSTAKGTYVLNATLSGTMTPGIRLDASAIIKS